MRSCFLSLLGLIVFHPFGSMNALQDVILLTHPKRPLTLPRSLKVGLVRTNRLNRGNNFVVDHSKLLYLNYSLFLLYVSQLYIVSLAAPFQTMCPGTCGQWRPRSACASTQSEQGLRCPQTDSLDTIECISREQIPGWRFEYMQDYVNMHTLRIFEGTFSLEAAHLMSFNPYPMPC